MIFSRSSKNPNTIGDSFCKQVPGNFQTLTERLVVCIKDPRTKLGLAIGSLGGARRRPRRIPAVRWPWPAGNRWWAAGC
jgi:hypothetical protein